MTYSFWSFATLPKCANTFVPSWNNAASLRTVVVICRVRTQNTLRNHDFIFKNLNPPSCLICNVLFTIAHTCTSHLYKIQLHQILTLSPFLSHWSFIRLTSSPFIPAATLITSSWSKIRFHTCFDRCSRHDTINWFRNKQIQTQLILIET